MCGRYSLEAQPKEIVEAFALAEAIAFSPRYNIAPTQSVPVVRADAEAGGCRLDIVRWGLTPSWSKGPRPIINARSETVADKPSFRSAFRGRRCLVPATGFYEWQKLGGAKQPFHIQWRDRRLFAFAGVWDRCLDPDGNPIEAFAILTTKPNRTMSPIHDRMPVMLDPAAYSLWLETEPPSLDALKNLLVPAPDEHLTAYPVSTRVNSPARDDAACVKALAEKERD
ncbi:MAG: SOS response-associated peptidase [Planctomycetota bacterium]|jgi:putative SOS response-associated peptidase YedK